MRTTLVGSLLDALRANRARGTHDVGLFEVGAVYLAPSPDRATRLSLGAGTHAATGRPTPGPAKLDGTPLPDERLRVGALLTGALRPASWRDPEPPAADLFAAKGLLAAALDALRTPWSAEPDPDPPAFLHPGRAAVVLVAGEPAGWLGELHPAVAARWDVDDAVAGFELDLDAVTAAADAIPHYRDLTSLPSVRQDLAVVVADDVPAAAVLATVRAAGGALLAVAEVFDVYRGAQVGDGRASLALRLEFRAPDRTLTDDEVAGRRTRIVDALRAELGGELRG